MKRLGLWLRGQCFESWRDITQFCMMCGVALFGAFILSECSTPITLLFLAVVVILSFGLGALIYSPKDEEMECDDGD